MNLENLQRKLIAAARAARPSDRVPYAFEKRIMARLLRGAPVDWVGEWSRALWRAAAGCIAVVLLTAAFSAWNAQRKPGDFSREFEIAVFASPGALDDIQ